MKTIKIFLASSEELSPERENMTDLIYQLNKLFKGRGLVLDLEKWEYLDSSMGAVRKQDEYNEVLKGCEMCLAVFWRRFGEFTGEEFDTAYQQMVAGKNPKKIYVFFKNVDNEEDLTPELKAFKGDIYTRYGHFFCKFANVDTMKLEFLLQLENYQKSLLGENAIEVRQEHVYVGNEAIADLNNIPFTANNEGFKKVQAELKELDKEIAGMQEKLENKQRRLEKKKALMEKYPDNEDYKEDYEELKEDVDKLIDELQPKINKYNKMKEDFDREQQSLFNTARRIAELRGSRISERMTRAIDAFEGGDAQRADAILDEAEHDADEALADIRTAKRVGLQSLEELLLKASVKMANDTIPIDVRVKETLKIYEKADALAKECDYEKDKYIDLLFEYERFLRKYSFFKESKNVIVRLLDLCKNTYGEEHPQTATAYSALGMINRSLGENKNVMEYYNKALEIRERILDKNDPDLSNSYTNIGIIYMMEMKDYTKALEYLMKGLEIREKIFGSENASTADSYNKIGLLYRKMGNYSKSLEFHEKALAYRENCLGVEHPSTAISYQSLGSWYRFQGMYDKALEFYKKARPIVEKAFGLNHRRTAILYANMGLAYDARGDYEEALDWLMKALEIRKALYEPDHPEVALSFNNIGRVYRNMKEYDKALEFCDKGLHIREKMFGEEHPKTAGSYESIAKIHKEKGDNNEALKWVEKAMKADPNNSEIISLSGTIYQSLGKYEEALEQFELCMKLKQEKNASEESVKETEEKINELKKLMEGR